MASNISPKNIPERGNSKHFLTSNQLIVPLSMEKKPKIQDIITFPKESKILWWVSPGWVCLRVCFVGFSDQIRKKLENLFSVKQPVQLTNWTVQSTYAKGDELELVLADSTIIGKSTKHCPVEIPKALAVSSCTDNIKDIILTDRNHQQ